MAGLILMLGVGIFFSILICSGCSRAPEDPAWFQSTVTGEALPVEELRTIISRTDSLLDLHRMKVEYVQRGGDDRLVLEELDRRRDQIVDEQPPLGSPSPEIDLLAFDYRQIGPGRFRADYLFRVNQPLREELHIALYGAVAPEHLEHLSPRRQEAGADSELWTFRPEPPTTAWPAGDYLLLTDTFRASAVPYNMTMVFYDPERDPSRYGEPVHLGWHRGVTESGLLHLVRRADNLIDLYRLRGDVESLPAVRGAFQQRSDELLEETPPLGRISDEVELLAFDYTRIGEDRYRVDFLFCLDQPLEFDSLIILYGVVDEAHREMLSEARREEGRTSEAWSFRPQPRTRDWPAERCTLVSHEIAARPIPYNMRMILYDRENNRQHGELLHLGWRADPGRTDPAE